MSATMARVGVVAAVVLVLLGVVVMIIASDSIIRVLGVALFVLGTGQAVNTYRLHKKVKQ
ncbi:hypothetical protein [Agreia sp.]|uniref:hypothetical protein n=1 Tax=Agreia sp. TaxID=1872416 RepID=UPI0035BC7365